MQYARFMQYSQSAPVQHQADIPPSMNYSQQLNMYMRNQTITLYQTIYTLVNSVL